MKRKPSTYHEETRQLLSRVDNYLTETLAIIDQSLGRNRPDPFPVITDELHGLLTKARRDALSGMQIWIRYNLAEESKKDPIS